MSLTSVTTAAAWMSGLALVALLAAGWRQNARATRRPPRADPLLRREWRPVGVGETVVPLYRRPGPVRRIWAVVVSAALAVVIGAVVATLVAYGLAFVVTTLTDLLKN